MLHQSQKKLSPPVLSPGNDRNLSLDSQIQELPMYNFALEISCTGEEVAHYLEKYPQLPGVILLDEGIYYGMISRCRFLEFLILPQARELFFQQPLKVIYSYARTAILQLPAHTSILNAMQIILQGCYPQDTSLPKTRDFFTEPLLVHNLEDDIYYLLDVQEVHLASWKLRETESQIRYERSQVQIIQNEKMASLGRLVDGITHEIVDPVGFIWGNLTYVSNYSQDLLNLIATYERELSEIPEDVSLLKEEIEFDFLEQDLSQALASIHTGAERLKKMVSSLQNFCHIDDNVYQKPIDIHLCINNILLLIQSQIKKEIKITKEYDVLPPVLCFPGELYQVFMNIIIQAVDNLLDGGGKKQRYLATDCDDNQHEITIKTSVIVRDTTNDNIPDSRWVVVSIADNGVGMSKAEQKKITSAFTNAKKSDFGLALSYQIITARHGGQFNLRSQLGKGTEIEILLPLL
ncbi:MAG: sensor histidine kinase [Richelia sp.]|nr:sensor histidine kinase [Richelia sp.]